MKLPLAAFLPVTALSLAAGFSPGSAAAADPWLVFEGGDGPGKGKHIVLISGDEEYRSEEGLPQLGKILSRHHGFKCTVLFAIDPATGTIDPNNGHNIPGTSALATADLLIILTRFRDLPDEQMKPIVDYLESGKPVLGLRTATHAFNIGKDKTYARYSYNFGGKDYEQGFGRQVLGETWISHHGGHKSQATRGIFAPGAAESPLLRGIKDGEIFALTDVYGIRLPQPEGCVPLVLGQVVAGMKPTDPALEGEKNNPMMPVAWTKTYRGGRVFTTTMGASNDLANDGVRRLVINAAFWCVGLEDQITPTLDISLVGPYEPSMYGFLKGDYWKEKALKVEDLK